MSARLFCLSVLMHCAIGTLVCAQDARPSQLRQSALGLSRSGAPIAVQLAPDAENLHHRGSRLVIIGGHDGDPASTEIVRQLQRELLHSDATAKHKSQVTVVPSVYPAGLAKGVADEEATRGYPPENGYYDDPLRPESRYLWRWVNQYGADLVIDIRTGKEAGYWLQKGLPTVDWLELILARDWKKLPPPAVDDFVVQLSSKRTADTGVTPALVLQIPPAAKETAFKKIHLLLQLACTLDQSPARRELIRRDGLAAQDVAVVLNEAYRGDLLQPILANKLTLDLMRNYPGVLGPWYEGWIDDARAASEWAWNSDKLKELYERQRSVSPQRESDRDVELVRELYLMALADRSRRSYGDSWTNLLQAVVEPSADQFESCEAILTTASPLVRSAGSIKNRSHYMTAGLEHYRRVRTACRRADGLFRHSAEVDVAWGRGNGLAAMGLAVLLSDLPEKHPASKELEADLQAHIAALLKHQDEFGDWRQVIDQPGSYAEFHATCLIAWTLNRCLEHHWLDARTCRPALDRAWRAVKRRVAPDGKLSDVCDLPTKLRTPQEYAASPASSGLDPRGGAIAILLATELMTTEIRPK